MDIDIDETIGFNPQIGEFGPKPQIIHFEPDRYLVSDLTPVLISWRVEQAETIEFEGELVNLNGTKSISILSPKTLKLKATNGFGSIEKEIVILIENIIPIINISAISRTIIAQGQSFVIEYNIVQALRAEINGIDLDINKSSIELSPNITTTYQIYAYSLMNEVRSELIYIEVIQMPKIEIIFSSPSLVISFNRRVVKTQLPDLNLLFPLETESLTKIDERLLKSENDFDVVHTLKKRILKILKTTFLILTAIAIFMVLGFYFIITTKSYE